MELKYKIVIIKLIVISNSLNLSDIWASLVAQSKEYACQAVDVSFIPRSGRCPREGNGKPTPVFFPGKSHGQKSLVGCSPWGCKRVGVNLATKKQKQQ